MAQAGGGRPGFEKTHLSLRPCVVHLCSLPIWGKKEPFGRRVCPVWGKNWVDSVTAEIVILAMVAAFLGLRLFAVLGRRAEHSDEPVHRLDGAGKPAPARLPERPGIELGGATPRPKEALPVLPAVERGLRDIASADRRFDPPAFLEAARGAYQMILEAFWKADREALAKLCDAHVLAGFNAALDARAAAGDVIDHRLVRIETAVITAAAYAAPIERVTIRFVADVAAVTRNAAGEVIAGSLTDAVEVRDVWTFSRNVASPDPDWHLDETDAG